MRDPINNVSGDVKMTMSHMDATGESRIDKMRKFLSSPLTRKKPNGSHLKTFGTPLETLVQRSSSEVPIPFVVTRICQYIEHGGLMHEGVFRISGNARLIERLKTSFDQTGDAPLESEGDVASAAALLKLFFRELPDPVIPLSMHQQFLNAVKGNDRESSVAELALLVENLPVANFSVLKYLSYFLTSVCKFEAHNRMSASSLGIVFGPNLFRVTDDFVGLKEQSLTNQIVTYFITDYFAIFHDEPKHYHKNISSAVDAHTKHTKLSTSDSMVASWPKLSAFPSIASSLNLRPLSVSIPTMGRSGFPINPYAESLDNKEHILVVDEFLPVEESHSAEQVSDQSEQSEDGKEDTSTSRRRKERRISDNEDDSLLSESKRYWKDFYFIDDTDVAIDSPLTVQNSSIDENVESFPENLVAASSLSYDENRFDTESDVTPPIVSANIYQDDDHLLKDVVITSQSYAPENIDESYKYSTNENVGDNTEFSMSRHRPARADRFGHSHKHYQRSGHRTYYYKKQIPDTKRVSSLTQDLSPEDDDSVVPDTLVPPTELAVPAEDNYSNNYPKEHFDQIPSARQFLRLSGNSEAPVSPSAYRSYLSHRNPHLDPNLPPSPPVEQEDLATGPMDDVNKAAAKLLSRRIQSLKKKVKRFEESFEANHGYRPSHAEKSQHSEIKKYMEELNQARQDLKQLKEEQSEVSPQPTWHESELLSLPKYNNKGPSQGFIMKEGTIEESLQQALDYLAEKRKSNKRPDLLEDMTKEQLTDEKLSIQKLLLQFESVHGRPTTKTHRDIMRPLYDRYRSAKRILARSASFGSSSKIKDSIELQPILEHETMDFKSLPKSEDCISNNGNTNEETVRIEVTKPQINLHELSLPELYEQQQQARSEKRKLRRILKEFEEDFQKEKGRKVQREDKMEMESVYSAYKHVRARLKLLEALATKHGHRRH